MREASSFWSRRRAAVQAEAEAEARVQAEAEEQARVAALAEKDDAEILSDLGLPDPAAMQQGDDFAAFMSRDVPEHLRKQALRTLWRSNPVLACVDGLNDYDDDYRAAMLAQKPFKTAYQVGKGMMAHIEEMERQAQAATAEAEPVAESAADEPEAPVSPTQTAAPEEVVAAADLEAAPEDEMPTPRRMRFHFEEASA